mmetsp:Transcript_3746/g.10292  ORF Transcript_3746/g.10292 Transcript_3746/m.10292 type:complete len:212 (-) Transcript_3746:2621-3256(-)
MSPGPTNCGTAPKLRDGRLHLVAVLATGGQGGLLGLDSGDAGWRGRGAGSGREGRVPLRLYHRPGGENEMAATGLPITELRGATCLPGSALVDQRNLRLGAKPLLMPLRLAPAPRIPTTVAIHALLHAAALPMPVGRLGAPHGFPLACRLNERCRSGGRGGRGRAYHVLVFAPATNSVAPALLPFARRRHRGRGSRAFLHVLLVPRFDVPK